MEKTKIAKCLSQLGMENTKCLSQLGMEKMQNAYLNQGMQINTTGSFCFLLEEIRGEGVKASGNIKPVKKPVENGGGGHSELPGGLNSTTTSSTPICFKIVSNTRNLRGIRNYLIKWGPLIWKLIKLEELYLKLFREVKTVEVSTIFQGGFPYTPPQCFLKNYSSQLIFYSLKIY